MRNFLTVIVLSTGTFILTSCNREDRAPNYVSTESARLVVLPNTPELVVKAYEKSVANNDFGLARRLSTGESLKYVNMLDSLYHIEPEGARKNNILEIKCREKNEKADCDCIIEEPHGKSAFKHFLIKQSGQWLVKEVNPLGPVAALDTPRLHF
ncbi:MAG: hypothetical protein RIS64_4357 [Bacteroidota bacterium]|jgi:hypothetical protein